MSLLSRIVDMIGFDPIAVPSVAVLSIIGAPVLTGVEAWLFGEKLGWQSMLAGSAFWFLVLIAGGMALVLINAWSNRRVE